MGHFYVRGAGPIFHLTNFRRISLNPIVGVSLAWMRLVHRSSMHARRINYTAPSSFIIFWYFDLIVSREFGPECIMPIR